MKAKLLGIQPIQFTNSNGQDVCGMNIFIASTDENVEGYRADKLFLRQDINLPKEVKLNDTIEIGFTMKGKVESISKSN